MYTEAIKIEHRPRTRHAERRIEQRRISPDALQLVLVHGHDLPAGEGCVRREIRLSQISELSAEGFPLRTIEAALRIEAILSGDDVLITCYGRAPRLASRLPCDKVGHSIRRHRRV